LGAVLAYVDAVEVFLVDGEVSLKHYLDVFNRSCWRGLKMVPVKLGDFK
jgi:hypothetical protein